MTTTNAELKIAPVDQRKWDRISEDELAEALTGGPAPLAALLRGIRKLYVPPEGSPSPLTCAFQTSKGSRGLLQILGASDNPRGVKIRYKQVRAGAAANAQPLLVGSTSLSFGPVVEAVLNDLDDRRGSEALDLRTGQVSSIPAEVFNDPEVWFKTNQMNLLVECVDSRWGFMVKEVDVAAIANRRWEDIQPDDVRRSLALERSGLEVLERNGHRFYLLAAGAKPPLNFAFQTDAKDLGLLQITSLSENPRSVTIRYRLAQPARRSSADLPSRSPTSPVTGGELSRADGATGVLNAAAGVGQVAAAGAKRSADASGVPDTSRHNPDVLGVQIRQAEAEVARLKGMVKANLVAPHDLEVAQDKLEILKAQLDGDDVKVAQIRVTAAERQLKHAADLFAKGLVAASEFDAAKAEVEIRRAELRAAQAAREPGASFGPVIERVVNGSGGKSGFQGLDLESGEVFTVAAEDLPSDNDLVKKWVHDHGIDLLVRNKGGSKWQLAGLHTQLAPVAAGWWTSTSDDALRGALDEARMEESEGWQFVSVHVDDRLPLVFAVQTGSGTVGLLRIAGSTDNEHGLKIRYKLVNPTGGPAARR